jgi:Cu+-exporting ATPase
VRKLAIAIDPICKMEVDTDNPAAKGDYKGTTYYFCMQGCHDRFFSDPERFLGSTTADPMKKGFFSRFKK